MHTDCALAAINEQVRPLPKSLQNIFKELEDDLGVKAPTTGDLSHWAEQGVLLLNSILTVHEGQPLSHANKGWEQFTDAVIETINREKEGVIFVLWGSPAQAKASRVDAQKHLILKAPHPSPLSAYRGFFGSKPFSTINRQLEQQGKSPISWVLNGLNYYICTDDFTKRPYTSCCKRRRH